MLRRVSGLTVLAGFLCSSTLLAQEASDGPPVLEVTARDYELQTPATEIPSGWTTVEVTNEGEETHELQFRRLPDGASYSDLTRYLGVIDTLGQDLKAGIIDSAEALKALKRHRPAWFSEEKLVGGSGMLGPNRSATTTIHLEPGTYALLCAVRDSAGKSHVSRGMRRKMTVTAESSGATSPDPDVKMALAHYEMTTTGRMSAGEQTVAVHFGDRSDMLESPFQGVHLVRLEENTSVKEVVEWTVDYTTPAPADFMGGIIAMPPGNTAYLTVDLEPGRYLWVSNSTQERGMKRVFTVGEASAHQR